MIEVEGSMFVLLENSKISLKYSNARQEEYEIPRSIIYEEEKLYITKVLDYAFLNSPIKVLSFAPESEVTEVSSLAFVNSSIKTVFLPKSLKTFSRDLQAINIKFHIPSDAKYFTNINNLLICRKNPLEAICSCYKQRRIQIRRSFIKIDDLAFCNKAILKTVKFPSSVTQIGRSSFLNCTSLEKIIFENPSNIKIIMKSAFMNCGIKKLCIPSSVIEIGPNAFHRCQNLRVIRFAPNSQLKIIGDKSFSCTKIEKISIPDTTESIGNNTFDQCHNLRDIIIPYHLKLFDKLS